MKFHSKPFEGHFSLGPREAQRLRQTPPPPWRWGAGDPGPDSGGRPSCCFGCGGASEGSVGELGAPCCSSRHPAGVGMEAQEAGTACRGAGLRGPGGFTARSGPLSSLCAHPLLVTSESPPWAQFTCLQVGRAAPPSLG